MAQGTRLIGNFPTNRADIPIDQLGAPGTRGTITITPIFETQGSSNQDWRNDINARDFLVLLLLSKKPQLPGDIKGEFTADDGESYLLMPYGKERLEIMTEAGIVYLDKNRAGEVEMATIRLHEVNFWQARTKLLSILMPFIDHLSYVANVPIATSSLLIRDMKHEAQEIDFIAPFQPVLIEEKRIIFQSDLLPIYAMYREARNSSSPYYQLLCYFKIMEGLSILKSEIMKMAKHENLVINPPLEIIPYHNDLAPEFVRYIGKSIHEFRNSILTKTYRDAIAHFMLNSKKVVNVSAFEEIVTFSQAAFASELCVRILISNHEWILQEIDRKKLGGM